LSAIHFLQNAEPSRRREWERCWVEFVVLKPVVLRRLVMQLLDLPKKNAKNREVPDNVWCDSLKCA